MINFPFSSSSVSTRKVIPQDNSYGRVAGSSSGPPSVSSYRSSNTGKSKTTTGSGKSRTSKNSDMDLTGKIVPLDDDEGDFANLSATAPLFDLLQKAVCHIFCITVYLYVLLMQCMYS
jgi:hypothetical protein